jgi:hypothetical protein
MGLSPAGQARQSVEVWPVHGTLFCGIKKIKNFFYQIDELARAHGKTVLRLPPYHSHFNPIELIWAQFKRNVRVRNSLLMADKRASLTTIQKMAGDVFEAIPMEHVANTFEHCRKIWQQYVLPDVQVVHIHENVGDHVIDVGDHVIDVSDHVIDVDA